MARRSDNVPAKGRIKLTAVVGIGASAGGLDAFKELLPALAPDSNMAFLLVQHLDPSHESHLTELLAPHTAMPVVKAEQGAELKANTIYVIPPNTALGVRKGKLELVPPKTHRGVRLPIDYLFQSLAKEYGARAAGIVLSGAGEDGTAGLKKLKKAGGLTIAQDPSTAAQPGMPQSAIESGAVDAVMRLAEIPAALARLQSPGPEEDKRPEDALIDDRQSGMARIPREALLEILPVLESHAAFDLRVFKAGTVERRILRRMTLGGHSNVEAYMKHLRRDQPEQKALVRDLLIGVTEFFRDPEAFETLRSQVVEPLVESAEAGSTLRAWVPGCATGEEAYSIAILFLEMIERSGKRISLHVFATDVDEDALTVGRLGVFPASITEHVPEELLHKYFRREKESYRVMPRLRDTISFAAHDVTKDAPFSKMSLVSCRNLFIYLESSAQEHALRVLHFALQPDCYLFLGSSESTGAQRQLFQTLSKKWRIYRKVGASRLHVFPRQTARPIAAREENGPEAGPQAERVSRREIAPGELARRSVMNARVPPTVVVAKSGAVLFMHGELRPFLRFPDGEPRFDLATLVSPDLATRTRAALYKCRRDNETVAAISSPEGNGKARTKIVATPAPELEEGAVILSFEEVHEAPVSVVGTPDNPTQEAVIDQIERELIATREDLRSAIEELGASNEELRSANEESSSVNEELQSANEELEATTEELRSVNEELTSVNAQLRDKLEQLEKAHDDISNFFASTKIATLFLDERLSIKRFTPAAEELLRIDSGDEGRLVEDIARELLQNGLAEDARAVLTHLSVTTRELRTAEGRWIVRRVLPYRTKHQRIEGVVVTFVDVTDLKMATEQLSVRERQQAVIARLGARALEDSDIQGFLDQTVREVQQTLETDYCKILELQPGGESLLLRAGIGWQDGLVLNAAVSAGLESQAGFTLRVQAPVVVDDLAKERRFSGPPLLIEHGIRSGLSCTIHGSDEPYGVIGVHTKTPRRFTAEEANFLQAVAAVIAGAVSRYETRARLALEGAVARALTDSADLQEAAARIHAAAARELGAEVAELWQPAGDSRTLERTAVFAAPPYTEEQLREEFGPSGLLIEQTVPGRVFLRHRAEWLSSLQQPSRFLRVEAARKLGLMSGFVFPIVCGNEPVAVMALFSSGRMHGDSVFLRSLEALGRAAGDFVRRLDVERRFRSTVEHAPVGIAERSFDGRWIRINDRLCEITGYTREEVLAASFPELTHPEDSGPEQKLVAELREGRRDSYTVEKRYLRKDGSAVWVNLSVARAGGTKDGHGYCVVIIEDISRRKAAEADLRDSESRFREVLLNSPVPMVLFDEHGAVHALSRSWTAVTGYTIDDMPTMDAWREKAFRERAAEVHARAGDVWTDGPAERHYEVEVWTKSGELKTLMLSAVSLGQHRDGRRLRIAAAADISKQRRYERELVEASRHKDTFIAMLGHELRNPLAAVRSAAELLKLTHPADSAIQRTQAVLERQMTHMARLLDGLLDVSRLMQGKITLEKKVVDLRSIVNELLADAGARPSTNGVSFSVELPGEPLWVEGDNVRLTQVVDNLVSNAIKYTPPPGAITIALTKEADDAVLRVRDTGVGIEPALLPNLFVAFQQGHQNLARTQGGMGLGLALVRLIAELHGGTAQARSEGPGRGSEFVVRLPLTEEPRPIPGRGRAAPGPRRILIIEDNVDAADTLSRLLAAEGHEVVAVARGAEGITRALEWKPDVVLCDLGLPGGVTGFDVAAALRGDRRMHDVRLIAITGYGSADDRMRTEEAGFDDHLTKPVALEALKRVL